MPTIDFQERELEDFLCEGKNLEKYLGLRFIGRQIKTPNGVLDILAYNKKCKVFVIIELKRDLLDFNAYLQVERYAHYLNMMKCGARGRRVFQRLLVGKTLHSDLSFLVDYYSGHKFSPYYERVQYRLFSFSFTEAIAFTYFNNKQREIQEGVNYE